MTSLQTQIMSRILSWTCRHKRDASEQSLSFPLPLPFINQKAQARVYTWPYFHIVIDDFLEPDAARSAAAYIEEVVRNKEHELSYFQMYDLFSRSLRYDDHPALQFLFDFRYKHALEHFLSYTLTEHATTAIHNNTPRSEDKYIHSDWSLVSFSPHASIGRIFDPNPKGRKTIFLEQGTPVPPGEEIERRAMTSILYLSPDWRPGAGGETGIFADIGGKKIEVAAIEPRFNRLLIFENTPHSFHNYKASSLPNRNSVIQWLHVDAAEYRDSLTVDEKR